MSETFHNEVLIVRGVDVTVDVAVTRWAVTVGHVVGYEEGLAVVSLENANGGPEEISVNAQVLSVGRQALLASALAGSNELDRRSEAVTAASVKARFQDLLTNSRLEVAHLRASLSEIGRYLDDIEESGVVAQQVAMESIKMWGIIEYGFQLLLERVTTVRDGLAPDDFSSDLRLTVANLPSCLSEYVRHTNKAQGLYVDILDALKMLSSDSNVAFEHQKSRQAVGVALVVAGAHIDNILANFPYNDHLEAGFESGAAKMPVRPKHP